jgi:hypothetical protein
MNQAGPHRLVISLHYRAAICENSAKFIRVVTDANSPDGNGTGWDGWRKTVISENITKTLDLS